MHIPLKEVPSPCYIIDEKRLRSNLSLMQQVQQRADIDIILALKGFAMWKVFPIIKEYLQGATASSLYEAKLCYEEMGVPAHTYCVAYHPEEFEEILLMSSHITFNSLSEYNRYKDRIAQHPSSVSCGIRINPEYSDVSTALYNPAAPGSRLGEPVEAFDNTWPEGLEGIHFHTLCESDSHSLEQLLNAFEQRFAQFLPHIKWVNMGGGHLMTRKGYNVEHLIDLLTNFKKRHQVEIILEPGSAVAWDTGILVATVLDIVKSKGICTAILDVSFTAHMPDTLEMPYRPRVWGATDPQPGKPTYRLGGLSCLAGDYMTAYSFDQTLQVGDQIVFEDMIHYTMVKTTMFNGVKHPHIAMWNQDEALQIFRSFGYQDFKERLS